jgi:hypothetical protein
VEPVERRAETDPGTPEAAPPPETGPSVAAPTGRAERTPKDMAVSLLVLLVPIALLLVFYRVVLDGDQPIVVDTAAAVEQARASKAFPVAEPTGLEERWRPVSATWQDVEGGKALRIGYVTPEGDGAQLVQTDAPVESFLPAELTAQARQEGVVDVGGQSWQRYTARRGEHALVLLEPARTTLVVGSASDDELRRLAGALR